jgi:hypothetical protein
MGHTSLATYTGLAGFCAGMAFSCISLTALHEAVLRRAGHVPAIVDDEALWCVARRQVATLGNDDVLLLGASRMQTDIDEATMTEALSGRRIINLAVSGGGTSLPVLWDIIRNTRFAGLIIVDETEDTMATDFVREQLFVDTFAHTFTLDALVNREIGTWLQSRLVCLGPGEACTAVWPRIAARGKIPRPKPNVTSASRYTRADYSLVDPALLAEIRRGRLRIPWPATEIPRVADAAVMRWSDPIRVFQARGGRVVFVRLPVSRELWEMEDLDAAASLAWQRIMQQLAVPSIICNGDPAASLGELRVMDHSHLDVSDTKRFTAWLCKRLCDIQVLEPCLNSSHEPASQR